MKQVDYRDADGWMIARDLEKVIPRSASVASKLIRHRVSIAKCDTKKMSARIDKTRPRMYRFSDEQWRLITEYGEELRIVDGVKRKGWFPTESTCTDGPVPIRLWFELDKVYQPIGWQWREDSERAWGTPSVGTLREAMDQLTGEGPIGMHFHPVRRVQRNIED